MSVGGGIGELNAEDAVSDARDSSISEQGLYNNISFFRMTMHPGYLDIHWFICTCRIRRSESFGPVSAQVIGYVIFVDLQNSQMTFSIDIVQVHLAPTSRILSFGF